MSNPSLNMISTFDVNFYKINEEQTDYSSDMDLKNRKIDVDDIQYLKESKPMAELKLEVWSKHEVESKTDDEPMPEVE